MSAPKLEVDERFFEVIASTETVALTKHRVSGKLGVWRLEWRDRGDFTNEADAWSKFMNYTQSS